jgi:predicted RNA-binding Zn ribbon-like protein
MADDGFIRLGNHPATDLCNTLPVVDGRPRELLGDFDDLLRWARGAGIDVPRGLVSRAGARAAEQTRRWVVDLRDELRVVLDPTAARRDLTALNAVLARDRGTLHLTPADRGVRHAVVRVVGDDELAQLRLDLAAAVLDVFSHDPGLVRRCHNPTCVLLFLDLSKSRRRRWCDMRTCGNRAKAATHYARSRVGSGAAEPAGAVEPSGGGTVDLSDAGEGFDEGVGPGVVAG